MSLMKLLGASQRRSYDAAFAALEAPTPEAFAARGRELLDNPMGPSRKGLQHPAAQAVSALDDQGLRHLGVDAYLRTGDVAPLVAALRQATRLDHVRARARWVAFSAEERGVLPGTTPRVPYLDGTDPSRPPILKQCLRALATGRAATIDAVLPSTLDPGLDARGPWPVASALLWIALHRPEPPDEARVAVRRCLATKVTQFERQLLESIVAILDDDPDGFAAGLEATTAAQAKVPELHTPFGRTAFLGKPVAIALFGLAVLAARRHGPSWVSAQPPPPRWPEGILAALLDESGPDALVVFDRPLLDAPDAIPELEAALWRERLTRS